MDVVGRERELAVIAEFLTAGGGAPAVLLMEGDAGMGKTTLCRAAADLARGQGHLVVSCVAAEAESQLSFTAVRDLVDDVLDDVAELLPGPQRRALAVALLREESRGPPPGQGSVFVGLQSTLRALAAKAPVLVVVDDIQWLDPPSAHALRYVIRRVDRDTIRFALARRRGHGDALGLETLDSERPTTLDVGALTIGALGRILQDRLGASYPRPTLARIHDVSGGNPFFALTLARALGRRARPLRPGEPFPVDGSLLDLVHARFTELPNETVDALTVASALSRPSVAALVEAVGPDVEDALDAGVAAELVELVDGEVRFTHPLFAAAAYDLATPRRRLEVHARLAEVAPDPEERARHLALATTTPSETAADALESAAHGAASRGAAAAAAELAEEAYRLTPEPDVERRSARALDAGWFQFIVGDAARARALLEDAEASAPAGDVRARARTQLGWLDHHAGNRRLAVERYLAALEDSDEPHQRAQIYSLLAWSFSIMREDASAAARYARMAVDLCDAGVDDPVLLADSLSVLAQAEFFLGGGLPSEAMGRALALPASDADLRVLRRPTNHWALMLLCADRFDEARLLFEEVRQLAVLHGDESAVPWPLMRLSHLDLAAGDWQSALRHAEEGLEAAVQTGQAPVQADLTCTHGLVLAHLGDVDESRGIATTGLALAEASSSGIGSRLAEWALGMLDLSDGDADAAASRLGPLWERSKRAGIVDPGENRYLGDLGEALVLAGDVAAANRVAEELAALGARLDRPSATGIALRLRGLSAAGRGDHDEALATLESAVGAHEAAGLPFELGRTLLALGSVARRARRRREARMSLQQALEIMERLGAVRWAERARGELARVGGRAPSESGLTPAEQRVAALVATGKTNKEVAAELVLSVHTIEAALTSIYRKLDVRSRTELAQKLATRG